MAPKLASHWDELADIFTCYDEGSVFLGILMLVVIGFGSAGVGMLS